MPLRLLDLHSLCFGTAGLDLDLVSSRSSMRAASETQATASSLLASDEQCELDTCLDIRTPSLDVKQDEVMSLGMRLDSRVGSTWVAFVGDTAVVAECLEEVNYMMSAALAIAVVLVTIDPDVVAVVAENVAECLVVVPGQVVQDNAPVAIVVVRVTFPPAMEPVSLHLQVDSPYASGWPHSRYMPATSGSSQAHHRVAACCRVVERGGQRMAGKLRSLGDPLREVSYRRREYPRVPAVDEGVGDRACRRQPLQALPTGPETTAC